MKLLGSLLAALAVAACLPSTPSGRLFGRGDSAAPNPSRAALAAAGLLADDARSAAYAGGDLAGLAAAFTGAALQEVRAEVEHLRRLGRAIERRLDARSLVHWSIEDGAASGVLAIGGWTRLVDQGAASGWSRFLEQWEFEVGWSGGWRVIREVELAPGEWWE